MDLTAPGSRCRCPIVQVLFETMTETLVAAYSQVQMRYLCFAGLMVSLAVLASERL